MVDPARTGVKAGRVVGLLTALLAVATVAFGVSTVYDDLRWWLTVTGVDALGPARVVVWLHLGLVAITRYVTAYLLGSLIGVVYDWLDEASRMHLLAMVLPVAAVDAAVSGLDARSPTVGLAFALAWLAFVPAFVWLHRPGDDHRARTTRIEEM
ncbi:MAG: hypothetical protein ACLFM8_05310 [Halobacteriales archaeon]